MKRDKPIFSRFISRLLMLTFILPGVTSCAGGTVAWTGKKLKYPVSLSPSLYGPDGSVFIQGRELVKVGVFQFKSRYWGIFYGSIGLNSATDIDEAMNKAIHDAGGDGITGLHVTNSGCGVNNVIILNILPIWPGCTLVEVSGSIVRSGTGGQGVL